MPSYKVTAKNVYSDFMSGIPFHKMNYFINIGTTEESFMRHILLCKKLTDVCTSVNDVYKYIHISPSIQVHLFFYIKTITYRFWREYGFYINPLELQQPLFDNLEKKYLHDITVQDVISNAHLLKNPLTDVLRKSIIQQILLKKGRTDYEMNDIDHLPKTIKNIVNSIICDILREKILKLPKHESVSTYERTSDKKTEMWFLAKNYNYWSNKNKQANAIVVTEKTTTEKTTAQYLPQFKPINNNKDDRVHDDILTQKPYIFPTLYNFNTEDTKKNKHVRKYDDLTQSEILKHKKEYLEMLKEKLFYDEMNVKIIQSEIEKAESFERASFFENARSNCINFLEMRLEKHSVACKTNVQSQVDILQKKSEKNKQNLLEKQQKELAELELKHKKELYKLEEDIKQQLSSAYNEYEKMQASQHDLEMETSIFDLEQILINILEVANYFDSTQEFVENISQNKIIGEILPNDFIKSLDNRTNYKENIQKIINYIDITVKYLKIYKSQ